MSSDPSSDLLSGRLARLGLLAQEMIPCAADVLDRVASDEIETVRLVFPDVHGILRGKTIVASALTSAFRSGITVPSTILMKDTSQRTAFPVWQEDAGFGHGALIGSSDVLLAPDPTTFKVLPWSPTSGWMLCDVVQRDGTAINFVPRTVLRKAIAQLATAGFDMVVGLEIEFHVFKVADAKDRPAEAGMPAAAPGVTFLTRNYELLGEARYDALEAVIALLRRQCVELGLPVRAMEAEFGPSQLEFVFDPADPLTQADATVLFRSMVKQVCARHGLHATFMCRPTFDACAASGWHIHQSIVAQSTGENIFRPASDGSMHAAAAGWIAGLLAHARDSCLLTTPTINGYRRFQAYQLAPNRIQWSHDNRGAMIRALMHPDDDASRIENRVAEPAANPYYVFASQIVGGLDGITRGLALPPPVDAPYDAAAPMLPTTLLDALTAFEASELLRDSLGSDFVDFFARIKRAEWDRYVTTLSEWEQREYFSLF